MCEDALPVPSVLPDPDQRKLRRTCWLLVLILLFATAYHWHPGGGWNVMTRLALIRAIVHDHTFSINRSHEHTGDKAEYPPGSGIYYSDKAIGGQVLGLLGYLVGYGGAMAIGSTRGASLNAGAVVGTWAAVGLPTIFACLLMLRILLSFGLSLRQAAFVTLGYALGTLAWPYSTVYYGHQPAAAFGLIAFYFAFRAVRGPRLMLPALSGLFAGWAIVTEFPAAIIAAALFVYIARRGSRGIVAFLIGGIPFIALQLACNWACFGSPLRFGYAYEANPEFAHPASWIRLPHADALWGITFSPDKGVFTMSPFLLFAVWGLWPMVRDRARRAEGLLAAAIVLSYFVYNSSHYMWQGGVCFGPRHIVPMLPFLCLGLGYAWPRMSPRAQSLCGLLAGWSVLVMFAAVNTIAEPAYQLVTGSPGLTEAFVRLSLGVVEWPTLGLALGLPGWGSAILHALLVGLPAIWLWRVTAGSEPKRCGPCSDEARQG